MNQERNQIKTTKGLNQKEDTKGTDDEKLQYWLFITDLDFNGVTYSNVMLHLYDQTVKRNGKEQAISNFISYRRYNSESWLYYDLEDIPERPWTICFMSIIGMMPNDERIVIKFTIPKKIKHELETNPFIGKAIEYNRTRGEGFSNTFRWTKPIFGNLKSAELLNNEPVVRRTEGNIIDNLIKRVIKIEAEVARNQRDLELLKRRQSKVGDDFDILDEKMCQIEKIRLDQETDEFSNDITLLMLEQRNQTTTRRSWSEDQDSELTLVNEPRAITRKVIYEFKDVKNKTDDQKGLTKQNEYDERMSKSTQHTNKHTGSKPPDNQKQQETKIKLKHET
jgi:hypothetical protein